MSDVPDKITIDDNGQIAPKVENIKGETMLIDVNGKRETVTMPQAWTLAMQILYQLRMHSEQHHRG